MDGSFPDPLGAVWLPSTAVGDGDEPGGEDAGGVATGLAVVGVAVAGVAVAGVAVAVVEGVGGCVAEADADGADAVVVGTVGALCVPVIAGLDEVAEIAEGLVLAGLAVGRSAIDPVEDAAYTAAPSATRPRTATIGRSANCLPRGRSVRQLGQKPETGVDT